MPFEVAQASGLGKVNQNGVALGLKTLSGERVRASDVLAALSYALDLADGAQPGHAIRSCVLGLRIAKAYGLPLDTQQDLYYALLLKDAGASSTASRLFHLVFSHEIKAKADARAIDWTRFGWDSLKYALGHIATGAHFLERARSLVRAAVNHKEDACALAKIRSERGASTARRIGFSERTAQAIRSLDEHWDGRGYPGGLRGETIPILSRIMSLAQTLDAIFAANSPGAALTAARSRAGRWFDPELARVVAALGESGHLWSGLDGGNLLHLVSGLEPGEEKLFIGPETLDNICVAFAEVIDAKTPFTCRHSNGVANAAVAIASNLGLPDSEIVLIRRAALLHDIGKLGVPNTILEKPGKLTNQEWQVVRRHPFHTLEILRRVPGFRDLSEIAAAHHERLDGSGYFRGWGAKQLSIPARILAVADVYDALAAARPYRDALSPERIFNIMGQESPRALDPVCVEALKSAASGMTSSLAALSRALGPSEQTEAPATAPVAAEAQK